MDKLAIYIANGVGIYLLIVLTFVSRAKIRRRHIEDRLFLFLTFGVMLSCVMEALSYAIDGHVFPGARLINYAANTYLYSLNLILPFCVLVYIDLGLYDDTSRIWKNYKPQIIVGIMMFSVTIVNFFVPVSYYITEQNVYERRPLSYVYYFVILYYCITALLLNRRYNKENGASAFLSINMFLIPILTGAALQFIFYGLSVAWLSAAIGLIGLYMMQQNELAFIDSLVDTYNRQYLNHIIGAWVSHGICFEGLMVDVDYFKQINDNYGHSEGDRALKTVTDILKRSCLQKELVFRFAGDEFIVLKKTDSGSKAALPDALPEEKAAGADRHFPGAVESSDGAGGEDMAVETGKAAKGRIMASYIAEVERRLAEYNSGDPLYEIHLSYGTSYYESGSIDAFIKEMDSNMYRMKASHHSREKQQKDEATG